MSPRTATHSTSRPWPASVAVHAHVGSASSSSNATTRRSRLPRRAREFARESASDGGRATDEEDGAEVYHGYQGTDAGTTTPALEAYLHRDVVRGCTGADWRRRPLGRLGRGARRELLRTMSILLREALRAANAARMSELQRAQLQGLLRPDVAVAWRTETEEKDLGFLFKLVSEARGMPPKWAPGKGLLA